MLINTVNVDRVNVDPINPEADVAATPGTWITTTEAAQRLGVKRATLYAYVSRGLLRSERRPGQQESLFDRTQIDAMASATRPPGGPRPVLRFRSIATSVSSQAEGELFYRGHPLGEVVALPSLEAAAAVVLGTAVPPPSSSARLPTTPVDLSGLPLERRMPVAVQLLAAADAFASDTDPDRVRAAALPTLRAALTLVASAAGTPDPARLDLAGLALAALGGAPSARADVAVLRVLLVALLDHGLTASTVAARVAASTRAGLDDCLSAAYAAMAGPLHGAAPVAAHALLADGVDPAVLVARSLRERGGVAGFGHFLYPDGDPRADVVLDALWRRRGTTRLRRRVEGLATLVAERTGALPNIDLASAAVLHALGLPAESGEVVFQVARSVGVAAHVVEEYAEEPLRWRGRDPQG
ncbi:citrate synthase [Terrabacter sp. Root181]|uniref:citrate synthase n=1 Tax=Terrabacter sp. Root181 TaxID=1736484 RepID=UPI0009E855AB|nr:citrate synthase [Terrabacter sp. Root181]